MTTETFLDLFIKLLSKIQDGEKQIEENLPKISEGSESEDLKECLKMHWIETKEQNGRLDKAFALISAQPIKVPCTPIQSIIEDVLKRIQKGKPSPVRDAEIIAAIQTLEHYRMAIYGTLRTFAEQFHYKEVVELFTETTREVNNADKTMSALAEGGMFSSGINQEAAKMNKESK